MKAVIVIPARKGSTRFPNKPLALIAGKPLLFRTWQIAQAVADADPRVSVVIATDDEEIRTRALAFGATVVVSNVRCKNGTERVFATLNQLKEQPEVAINLQGDAALTPPWVIQSLLQAMFAPSGKRPGMATPAVHLSWDQFEEYARLKAGGRSSGTLVVFDRELRALYFSKGIIPYVRDGREQRKAGMQSPYYRHIGSYAYTYETLKALCALVESPLERAEQLEQMRALENGIPIQIVPVDYKGRTHGSVDHLEDIGVIEKIIQQEGEIIP